jgi:hypothetical protein
MTVCPHRSAHQGTRFDSVTLTEARNSERTIRVVE